MEKEDLMPEVIDINIQLLFVNIIFIIKQTRNGHSLLTYKDKLLLFGGIHDITHEKNDMYIFNTRTKKWVVGNTNQFI